MRDHPESIRTGHRVGPIGWIVRCQNGHTMRLNPHSTVPPCGYGPKKAKCGSTRYKLQTNPSAA